MVLEVSRVVENIKVLDVTMVMDNTEVVEVTMVIDNTKVVEVTIVEDDTMVKFSRVFRQPRTCSSTKSYFLTKAILGLSKMYYKDCMAAMFVTSASYKFHKIDLL